LKAELVTTRKLKLTPSISSQFASFKRHLSVLHYSNDIYAICATPLKDAKKDSVFISVGRGPIVDEDTLVDTIKMWNLKSAAWDEFATEPLHVESALWTLDNVLMSPHNMDVVSTFLHEATKLFVEENLPRFVRGVNLFILVNKSAGY